MNTETELQLSHLAPYLPYKLGIVLNDDNYVTYLVGLHHAPCAYLNYNDVGEQEFQFDEFKPILRPMSDLWTPIDGFNLANYLYREYDITDMEFNGNATNPKYGYEVYLQLIKYNFDVFGLIDSGLAIDINTIEQK